MFFWHPDGALSIRLYSCWGDACLALGNKEIPRELDDDIWTIHDHQDIHDMPREKVEKIIRILAARNPDVDEAEARRWFAWCLIYREWEKAIEAEADDGVEILSRVRA